MSDKEKAELNWIRVGKYEVSTWPGHDEQERAVEALNGWKLLGEPECEAVRRIAPEKPEPLELWVNVAGSLYEVFDNEGEAIGSFDHEKHIGRPPERRVHMREVVPAEPFEANQWYEISDNLKVINKDTYIAIRDNSSGRIALNPDEIPALITALQGLMEGEE